MIAAIYLDVFHAVVCPDLEIQRVDRARKCKNRRVVHYLCAKVVRAVSTGMGRRNVLDTGKRIGDPAAIGCCRCAPGHKAKRGRRNNRRYVYGRHRYIVQVYVSRGPQAGGAIINRGEIKGPGGCGIKG